MRIHPIVQQQNGMILVSLQALFVGDTNDTVDKANILAFGDPQVNLTGGLFVDNQSFSATPATLQRQDLSFRTTTLGNGGNVVTLTFVAAGTADASAISVSGNAVTVDILPLTGPTRTTSQIATLFGSFPPTTTNGGIIIATGGSAATATTGGPFDFANGTPAFSASFSFSFPASDLFVGVTTAMQGYTARFMTQLPPPVLGIPAAVAGPLDCITSDPKHAAQYWINTIEARIGSLMTSLRQRTTLGPQSDATI